MKISNCVISLSQNLHTLGYVTFAKRGDDSSSRGVAQVLAHLRDREERLSGSPDHPFVRGVLQKSPKNFAGGGGGGELATMPAKNCS